MIGLARKFLRRPAADRRLLVHAFVLHGGVSALLRLVRFGRLSRWLGPDRAHATSAAHPSQRDEPVDPVEALAIERVVWAVHQATAIVPWGRTCLTEALTMAVLLRLGGYDTTLQYGVASDGEHRLSAHAWLERNGAVVGGSSPRAYAPLRQGREGRVTSTRLHAPLRIPDEVIFGELDGEAVVLNLDTGIYFGLDAVGTRIWQLLEEHKSLRLVLGTLVDEYEAPPDRLRHDLLAFVERLNGKGLITLG